MTWKTPLAWLQLTRQKVRLAIAATGIAFAAMLIFVQLGLKDALYASTTIFHNNLRADLVMLNVETEALLFVEEFSRRRLYQALGFSSVESVNPIYYGFENLKNVENGRSRTITVFGINPNDSPFNFPDVNRHLSLIKLTDVLLFDRFSRAEYGPISEDLDAGKPVSIEILGRRFRIGAAVDFTGPSFGLDGNLITSDFNFHRIFKQHDPENITMGLIRLKKGADVEAAIAELNRNLPEDIKVITTQDYVNLEVNHWQKTTPIGFIFSMGAVVGFLVGVIIVYQILYAEISDHVPDYAILKARGYQNRYFLKVLLQESVLLSLAGYIPGYLFSSLLYALAAAATGLPLEMELPRSLLVLVLTMSMCIISGSIAVRKLGEADPAELF